ncbi:hypothetical protein GOHSU_22_00580 [Gordonia hirsuta DSM 44140 = NBRC 16056]|uniref:Uncharacterized protein n=1 Tax=Gordonia hirsuta DSM 44140 = NBRC 16056 TaxID=1121927 RepID=L7LC38_9ACTN|nr:hypothetical protein [Gordonia hirsuta]GAC57598.1 hypothetical protein GOHSU_22_00580 [Gordonia hirsuta DSM 44140 = NBRC 16056]
MKAFRRSVVAIAACGAMIGGALLGVGQAEAAPKPQPFPFIYSNVKMPPMTHNGKPSPLNNVVWRHMTVFTHGQSVTIMNNDGAVQLVGNSRIAPYGAMANSAKNALKFSETRQIVARGGCLVTYWQDNDIKVPGYGWIGAFTYPTSPQFCHR